MNHLSFVKRIPFMGVFTAYLAGILLQQNLSVKLGWPLVLIGLLFLLILGVLYLKRSPFLLIVLYLLCLISGFSNTAFRENRQNHQKKYFLNTEHKIKGKVRKVSVLNKYDKCEIKFNPQNRLGSMKAIAYFERGKKQENFLKMGDEVAFSAVAQTIKSLKNPDAFDYSRFLKNKGFCIQFFVGKENWKLVSRQKSTSLLDLRTQWLATLMFALKKELARREQVALIQAITLGQKEELSDETLTAFSNTGARHILAVSGMHVGIIMLILQYILVLLPGRHLWVSRIKLLITLCGIWLYAWITGMAPPVTRASFMFSLLLLGQMGKNEYSSLNALFLSALILLLINPLSIFDLGFQFSYTALMSIILFYPLLNKRFRFSSILINYPLQIILLTLSVQPLILPLSIFYFHKVPLFSLISSLLVTPLAFLLMLFSLLFFIDFFFIHVFSPYLAWILGKMADWLDQSILFLDGLTFGTIENVSISPMSLFVLLMLALYIYALLKKPLKSRLFILLITLNVFGLSFLPGSKDKSMELCIYADSKMALLDIFDNGLCYSWNSLHPFDCSSTFANREHRIRKKVKFVKPLLDADSEFFIVELQGQQVGVFQSKIPKFYPCRYLDLLLIHSDEKEAIEELIQHIDVRFIVLSPAVKYKTAKWIADLEEYEVWDLKEKGAFVLKTAEI